MRVSREVKTQIAVAVILGVVAGFAWPCGALAQTVKDADLAGRVPLPAPQVEALPLAEDRGCAATEQALRRLKTTASAMMIVAHPDDEDGALLTYLSRGLGARVSLLTLTRGEGGQNAMSADLYDALGVIRTNELLKADEYYGVKQLWGTEADFGFSKTQEEAFAQWGHERVLYDAVLAVRRERPQVIVATFIGAITDGHGQHQVSGEIAQEVFKAAGDPKVFPEQLKDGLEPWQPRAVYGMVPFAPVTDGKMFDYATGKWAPARFKNYATGQWMTTVPSTDAVIPVGTWDAALGRSYMQIAREGWGEQKSQNGGANPTLSGPGSSSYHLWAVVPEAAGKSGATADGGLFHNAGVEIDTSIGALAKSGEPQWLLQGLADLGTGLKGVEEDGGDARETARKLAPLYRKTLGLYEDVKSSRLDAARKAGLLFELDAKIEEFQAALKDLLGLDLIAFTTKAESVQAGGPFRGGSADEMPRSVTPGQEFRVRVHTAYAASGVKLEGVRLQSSSGDPWTSSEISPAMEKTGKASDRLFAVRAAENAAPTEPYFTRPSTEQPYYDLKTPALRGDSFAPYPLTAWAEFTFEGTPIRLGKVVQTMERVQGAGGVYEPLLVTPAIGVRMEPEERIAPLDGSALPVAVTIHTEGAADGTVELVLPENWHADPVKAAFHRTSAGDTEPIHFSVTTDGARTGAFAVKAVARCDGHSYETGWESVGYAGLRPYNLYKTAELKTRKIDVKVAKGLRVAYVMGSGDTVPEALEGMGIAVHAMTDGELAESDLSAWNAIVVGIRAYSTRPALTQNQSRLDEFVRLGGTLVVQYQSSSFPAPLPMTMGGRMAERVVDERAPVKLLDPENSLLTTPNRITEDDFDNWIEERGHGFLDHWDAGYTALTETADPGQDPQRGGLLVAHPGRGTYIYVAYALYRQLPELVPGSYRLLANLVSAGKYHD